MEYLYDFYDIIEEVQTAANETAKQSCPEHCKSCEWVYGHLEDNTFSVSPRFKGDRTTYGRKYIVPYCMEDGDECAETIKECPLFIEKGLNLKFL